MSFLQIYAIAALVILGYITIVWIASLLLKNSSAVLSSRCTAAAAAEGSFPSSARYSGGRAGPR